MNRQLSTIEVGREKGPAGMLFYFMARIDVFLFLLSDDEQTCFVVWRKKTEFYQRVVGAVFRSQYGDIFNTS